MRPSALLRARSARKLLPIVVVIAVAVMVIFSTASDLTGSNEAFAFKVFWPSPSTYTPGTTPPAAYLEINYTGPGRGNYTFVITSNLTGTTALLGRGNALVSSLAPFRDYVFVNVSGNAVVLIQARVYRGSPLPQNLLFAKTISI